MDGKHKIVQSGMVDLNDDHKNDIHSLLKQLTELLNKMPNQINDSLSEENTDPAIHPMLCVSQWVDGSAKYGFGYVLSDGSVGVMFNDTTKIIVLANENKVLYIDRNGNEQNMTEQEYPEELRAKMKLLSYFKNYMVEHLVKAGGDTVHGAGDALPHSPHLHTWFRASCAIVTLLTNGSVQVNFSDHVKIILSLRTRTYTFSTISKLGCSNDLKKRLRYIRKAFISLTTLPDTFHSA